MNNLYTNEKYIQTFEELLSQSYRKRGEESGRTICERILSKELTAAPAFAGKKYLNSNIGLMVVGWAMNGWRDNFSGEDANQVVENIFKEAEKKSINGKPFDDIVNPNGVDGYFYAKSKFWKLIKKILVLFGEANDSPVFYDHSEDWNQKVVWSNLYKISPYDGYNPLTSLKATQIEYCIDLLMEEINEFKPKNILFITDKDEFNSTGYKFSFAEKLGFNTCKNEDNNNNDSNVVIKGKFNNINIVVCKRPDKRGNSDEKIKEMAEEIHKTFTDLEDRK